MAGSKLWIRPFLFCGYPFEWIVYYLKRWAFVEFLDIAGRFALLVAIVTWWSSRGDLRRQEIVGWWQILSSTEGRSVSGARIIALEELAALHAPLHGVNLSGAELMNLNLPNVSLVGANFDSAHVFNGTLNGGIFRFSSARGGFFHASNLQNAEIFGVDWDSAWVLVSNLKGANFRSASLRYATFENNILDSVDFSRADLRHAVFKRQSLRRTDFAFADLRFADLSGAEAWREIESLWYANIAGAKLPHGFAEWAKNSMHAVSIPDTEQWKVFKDSMWAP